MRNLERVTGVALLSRTHAGSPHRAGAAHRRLAEDVLDAADRLEAGLLSIRSGVAHRLAIAASQTIAEHLVSHWLVKLRGIEQADTGQAGTELAGKGQAPDTTPTVVKLTVANSTGVIELVRDVKVAARSRWPNWLRRPW
jgi:hypothetical protein